MTDARPIVLLTRPLAGSLRFSEQLISRFNDQIEVVLSPLQQIEWLDAPQDFVDPNGLIFTSQNGVLGWNRDEKKTMPIAFCVGSKTASCARELGLQTVDCGGDADAVVQRIIQANPDGPLVHYRGEHSRGGIAERLNQAGIETIERVVYRQLSLGPDSAFETAINSGRNVIAPLFSPRSAALFSDAVPDGAAPWLAVISANATERVDAKLRHKMMVASAPNSEAMLDSIEVILARLNAS